MECPRCHALLDDREATCSNCGAPNHGTTVGGGTLAAVAPAAAASPLAWILVGTTMACMAAMLGIFAAGYHGQSGAFLLIAIITFATYLALPGLRRHPVVERVWARFDERVDAATGVFVGHADLRRQLRREQSRLAAMRAERQRRIEALGEHAFRFMRTREVNEAFRTAALRVKRIETQIEAQERRTSDLRRKLQP